MHIHFGLHDTRGRPGISRPDHTPVHGTHHHCPADGDVHRCDSHTWEDHGALCLPEPFGIGMCRCMCRQGRIITRKDATQEAVRERFQILEAGYGPFLRIQPFHAFHQRRLHGPDVPFTFHHHHRQGASDRNPGHRRHQHQQLDVDHGHNHHRIGCDPVPCRCPECQHTACEKDPGTHGQDRTFLQGEHRRDKGRQSIQC